MEIRKKLVARKAKWIIISIVSIILIMTLFGNILFGSDETVTQLPMYYDKPHRGEISETREKIEALAKQEPDDTEIRLQLAHLQYQAGNFEKAKETVRTLIDTDQHATEALLLAAELEYLSGNYQLAEDYLNEVINLSPSDLGAQIQARSKLIYVYYQSNQYAKASQLFLGEDYQPDMVELMQSFGKDAPYEIVWTGEEHKSVVPFIVTNPLPVLPIQVNGKQIYVFIDTGGSTLILDHGLADELGIQPITADVGRFHADRRGVLTTGKADSVKIGNVTLKNVPITTLPVKEFTFGLLKGVIGTNVLQQFLATVDYPHSQLILYEKSETGLQAVQKEIEGKESVEIPFYLAGTHYMMAKGMLNDKDNLTFFVDSGLASSDAFEAPIQTLDWVGISVPDVENCKGLCLGVSGAGIEIGGSAESSFPIEQLGLGTLKQTGLTGLYGGMVPGDYWEHGFITDGLISHQYLKQYTWIIDFINMRMIFVPSS